MITEIEIKYEPVRALSWKQPYASMMIHGKQETRSWDTKYRGLVLICASLQPYNVNQICSISGPHHARRVLDIVDIKNVPRGEAIAVGRLVGSRPMRPDDMDKTFVSYYEDLFIHIYSDVRPIWPFRWKGKQGWSTLTEAEKAKIILL